MKFKFHLFVQKHQNRTYTVTVLPFHDLTAFGISLDEIKDELAEAVKERVRETPPQLLQHLEFDPRLSLHKTQVSLRPVDKKNHKKRREQVRLVFSLVVRPEEDGQLYVTVPKLGYPPLSFYVYNKDELEAQAAIELANWFETATLEHLMEFRHARSETLEALEVEIPLRKAKDASDPFGAGASENQAFWALREVGINLTAQAGEGRFRRAHRRDDVVRDILKTLVGSRNNSVLVTGPSEVGKTAILHEVVRRIHRKECDETLHERQVWMLTPDRLIAGAQYIGTWEERVNDIANECRQKQHILYVDDLPGLLEVGRWSKSDTNIAMALKPHIASGEVIILGECSPERLTMGMNLGASFMNLFRVIQVAPMVADEAQSVLGHVARELERELDLRIEPGALDTAMELTQRFLPYRSFPGKSIRLMETAASDAAKSRPTTPTPIGGSLLRRISSRLNVDRQHVIGTFSRQSGMPEFVLNDQVRLDMTAVERYFRERIMGQEQAIQAMVNLVATVKAGLNDPHKPLSTFLFIGPTGVGKTEMAKTLASYLFGDSNRLIRFDMSEYGNIDGVSRLIGAFSAEGELTRKVREQPFCVVLLDEFEKADPRIYDLFLQVLGEGRLTDARGKTTSFHNAILIMTSNLGSGQRDFRATGFGALANPGTDEVDQALEAHYRGRVEAYFRPEFINRIDQIVVFTQLTRSVLRQIASRELTEILRRDGITRRSVMVEIDDSVIDLVLEKGYSPVYGARPLKREIERLIVAPMARTLAQRRSSEQSLLRILAEHKQVVIKSVPLEEAERVESVTLTSALSEETVLHRRLDTPALVEGLAMLRRKLADWDASDIVKEMQREKAQLLQETQHVNFWSKVQDARGAMTRFYFLDRLLQRLNELLDRAEYLEDFGLMVSRERALHYQTELARNYEELHRQISYLDIELMTAHLPHRNQAMMLIRPLGMLAPASSDWPRRLAGTYLHWAEHKGYDFSPYLLPDPAEPSDDPAYSRLSAGNFKDLLARLAAESRFGEIAISVQGSNVYGFLKGERGLHKLAGRDSASDQIAEVRVFAIPDGTSIEEWLNDYLLVSAEIAAGKRPEPQREPYTVIRTYSLDRSEKFIRDLRTGVRLANVKDVMGKGMLDEFILAYLRAEESHLAWEDRFPPTFPY